MNWGTGFGKGSLEGRESDLVEVFAVLDGAFLRFGDLVDDGGGSGEEFREFEGVGDGELERRR